ncbi:NmrA family transcriptional regulator [Streptomyces filamentosus]|uniref:NmrA family transcriptional regulator n=2 Tax=Streptomyces filamentosus TaxID=67294 RepID=A0A919EKJ2_STRFL|nr:NmrA family transcriptional regulator [Streptomyces filamentosus]
MTERMTNSTPKNPNPIPNTTPVPNPTPNPNPIPGRHPVLVLGGTGKTGRRVVSRLRQRGQEVRVAARKGPVRFDWTDENTWEPVLDGVRAAYLVDSMTADAGDLMREFAKLAAARGVERLVLLSHRDWVAAEGEEKLPCERAVRESGAAWTLLKPSWFSQNFSEDAFFRGQVLDGELGWATGSGTEAFVDADDIADVAVAALTEDGHAGAEYPLTGPRLLSLAQVAEEISRATGREVSHRADTPEEFAARAARAGVPDDFTALLNLLFGWIAENRFAELADGVQRALGREPRDFAEYVRSTAVTGVWTP